MKSIFTIITILFFACSGQAQSVVSNNASATTSITQEYPSINVYPNPATEYFRLSESDQISSIEVFSVLGKLVKKFDVYSNGMYDINELRTGLYFVHLVNLKGKRIKSISLRIR